MAKRKGNIFFGFGTNKQEDINPTPVPIAYYTADTGSGATLFDNVGSNDLTINGATWITGKINNGLSFDGVDDYVGYSGSLLPSIFSLSFIAKGGGGGRIISDGSRPINCLTGFYVLDDFSIRVSQTRSGCSGDTASLLSNHTPTGSYEHCVITYDGSVLSIYINGVFKNSASLNFNRRSTDKFTIGALWNSYYSYYEGFSNTDVDEIGIWDQALTQEHITYMDNGGNYRRPNLS